MGIPIPAAGGIPVTVPAAAPVTPPLPVRTPNRVVPASRPRTFRSPVVLGLVALALVGVVLLIRHFMTPPPDTSVVATEVVGRQDIAQTVEATGTVQAINVVEIKSKASGEILKMPVVIGSVVKAGDLLVQIDPLTVRNQYAQALAAQQATATQVQVTTTEKLRSDVLLSQEAITAPDHEAAVLGIVNAQAAQAKSKSDLQIARQALDDATVRAPSDGRIIEQDATKGMVITSATSSSSGGTTILKMADLSQIEMNTLVAETDVGNLQPGMPAKVTVDAFPNRTFNGRVTMIEPQAVVQQSVTLFPVLVAIDNVNGMLLPGMNGEVTIAIASRTQAVAVPLDAVRTLREAPMVALSLGLNADSLVAQLQRQVNARSAARAQVAPDSATAAASSKAGAPAHSGRGAGGARVGGSNRTAGPAGVTAGARAARSQFVMVGTASGLEPRLVTLGISDFDYSEVLSGVQVGEQVALLSVAEEAAKRKQQQAQISQRVGSGLPGSTGSTGGGAGGRSGGGR